MRILSAVLALSSQPMLVVIPLVALVALSTARRTRVEQASTAVGDENHDQHEHTEKKTSHGYPLGVYSST